MPIGKIGVARRVGLGSLAATRVKTDVRATWLRKSFILYCFLQIKVGVRLFGFALFGDPYRTKRSSSYVIFNKNLKIVDPYRRLGYSTFFWFDFGRLFDDLKMMTPLS